MAQLCFVHHCFLLTSTVAAAVAAAGEDAHSRRAFSFGQVVGCVSAQCAVWGAQGGVWVHGGGVDVKTVTPSAIHRLGQS